MQKSDASNAVWPSRTISADIGNDMKSTILLVFSLVSSLMIVSCGGGGESSPGNSSSTEGVTFDFEPFSNELDGRGV